MSSSVEILEKAGGSLVLGEFARLRRGFSPPRPPCGACSVALIHRIAGFRPSAAGSARLDVVLAEWGGGGGLQLGSHMDRNPYRAPIWSGVVPSIKVLTGPLRSSCAPPGGGANWQQPFRG